MKDLISPKTAAENSVVITNGADAGFKDKTTAVTLYLIGGTLASEETIKVVYLNGAGATTYRDLKVDGSVVKLTENDPTFSLNRPLTFRVEKGATAQAVGVGIDRIRGM